VNNTNGRRRRAVGQRRRADTAAADIREHCSLSRRSSRGGGSVVADGPARKQRRQRCQQRRQAKRAAVRHRRRRCRSADSSALRACISGGTRVAARPRSLRAGVCSGDRAWHAAATHIGALVLGVVHAVAIAVTLAVTLAVAVAVVMALGGVDSVDSFHSGVGVIRVRIEQQAFFLLLLIIITIGMFYRLACRAGLLVLSIANSGNRLSRGISRSVGRRSLEN
jgi:hypothetical protein